MGIAISEQCLSFFVAVLSGFCFGFFYEFFRILRAAVKHNAFFCGLEDFFFCMTCTFCTILLCYAYGDGVVRWFVLVGILLGAFLYFVSLGQIISRATEALLRLIQRIIRRFFFLLTPPLKALQTFCLRQSAKARDVLQRNKEARKIRYDRKAKTRLNHFASGSFKIKDLNKRKER